ncbi:MAG: hypothetical protein PHE36_10550 [Novosphingobium sp.]|nr:hypothetical protein [Novosphingobium sp.]
MALHRASVVFLAASAAVTAAISVQASQNPSSGPVARYDIRAGTISGMGAMGQGTGAMMGMMFGGGRGNNVQHELLLRLGSSQAPVKGAPKAEHFMPSAARLGKSVQLTTPQSERGPVDEMPEKPKGRLLLFWGCGEHAPKGQPVVIDFSKLAAGQAPQGLWTTTIMRDWGPTLANSRTFGRWPSEDGKYVKPDSSLLGAHRIASNYAPEIAFTAQKDFMAPLRVTTRQQAGGATVLSWSPVPEATGYLAFLTGGKQGPGGGMGDMVFWTSSASRQFGGGLSDWLSPSQAAGLVRDKTILPPTATSCIVPVEVRNASPDYRFGTLTAYGPEEDFSYPPRPADASKPWNLEWTARIRHRSTTSWMEAQGMSMGSMDSTGAGAGTDQGKCRPRGLGGMLGGVMGAGGC